MQDLRQLVLLVAVAILAAGCGSEATPAETALPETVIETTDTSTVTLPTIGVSTTTAIIVGQPSTTTQPIIDSQQFYSRFGVLASPSASLLEGYSDLETLTRSADVVVLARVHSIDEPRVVAPDGDTVYIARILLDVEEVLSGVRVDARDDGLLVLEELTGTKDVSEELSRILPDGRAIYFLRNSAHFATGERQLEQLDFYVVPIPAAIMTEVDGRVEVPRTSEYSPIGDATRATDFTELLDVIRGYSKLDPIPVDLYQTGDFRTVYDLVGLRESSGG